MKYTSPLEGTTVSESFPVPSVRSPKQTGKGWQADNNECALQVDGVADFHVHDGRAVTYFPRPGADPAWVKLYLNGQVLVALLHQRKIINFHASSFVHDGNTVMVIGETGAGKSSLTLASVLHGAGFLTDDMTPIVFRNGVPCIMPLNRKIKIRTDTAEKLGLDPSQLTEAESGTGKKYLTLAPVQMDPIPLSRIILVTTGPTDGPVFTTPSLPERFALLRSEVCSWELLAGMPVTERAYLEQLVVIVEQVSFIRAVRSPASGMQQFATAVRKALDEMPGLIVTGNKSGEENK